MKIERLAKLYTACTNRINLLSAKYSSHRPTARAKTPTTPAMLAKIAPVGAGAPPVEDELAWPAADVVADAAEITELAEVLSAELLSALILEVANDTAEE